MASMPGLGVCGGAFDGAESGGLVGCESAAPSMWLGMRSCMLGSVGGGAINSKCRVCEPAFWRFYFFFFRGDAATVVAFGGAGGGEADLVTLVALGGAGAGGGGEADLVTLVALGGAGGGGEADLVTLVALGGASGGGEADLVTLVALVGAGGGAGAGGGGEADLATLAALVGAGGGGGSTLALLVFCKTLSAALLILFRAWLILLGGALACGRWPSAAGGGGLL